MNGLTSPSDTAKKNLKITDKKKKKKREAKRLLSIHPHRRRHCLTAHPVALMFSARDYIPDTGFL